MDEGDIILTLVSFSGVAGSFLGFFLIHRPEFEEKRILNSLIAFIALLLWLAVPLALFSIPYKLCHGSLLLGYWSAMAGSLLATLIVFLWNLSNTFWPPIKRLIKELTWEREAIRML